MCCARCTKKNKCACSVKSSVSDYKDNNDLDKLVKWSEKWQMLFNFRKCKCIHIGHGNMDE